MPFASKRSGGYEIAEVAEMTDTALTNELFFAGFLGEADRFQEVEAELGRRNALKTQPFTPPLPTQSCTPA